MRSFQENGIARAESRSLMWSHVRDDSRAFEMEEEERVQSLLFLFPECSHTAASGIRSNEHPCKNSCCALQALFYGE